MATREEIQELVDMMRANGITKMKTPELELELGNEPGEAMPTEDQAERYKRLASERKAMALRASGGVRDGELPR